jgi:hypothetical protein
MMREKRRRDAALFCGQIWGNPSRAKDCGNPHPSRLRRATFPPGKVSDPAKFDVVRFSKDLVGTRRAVSVSRCFCDIANVRHAATARRGPTKRTILQISAAQNTFPGGKVAPKATDEGTGSSSKRINFQIQTPIPTAKSPKIAKKCESPATFS